MSAAPPPRVLVVGSGWRFTSGISYYTCRLANALASELPTDVMLMRQLIPTALYPGRGRVGRPVNDVDYAAGIDVYDGVDWFWGRSMRGARRFIETERPDVVVLQWWTGAVLHSYLRLAVLARRRGAKVVMEWHEVQDTGEALIPGVVRYVRKAMDLLLRRVDAHVVHSRYDLDLLQQAYGLEDDGAGSVTVVPHGPYDHVRPAVTGHTPNTAATPPAQRSDDFTVLYFGIIRPYKGLEDLVEAFSALPPAVRDTMRLTIVGETWEGWDAPLEAVAASPARDRITVVNRYVTDAEAQQHFANADAVALPYRRSSSSGPLHMAMSAGLPTIVTSVGGLVDAASGYEGVTFVPPQDVPALSAALTALRASRGRRYADPHSWDNTVDAYQGIFRQLGLGPVAEGSSDTTLSDTTPSDTMPAVETANSGHGPANRMTPSPSSNLPTQEISMTTTTSVSHRRLLWALLTGLLLVAVTALGAGPANADPLGAAGATPPGKSWIRAGHFIPGFGAARVDLKPSAGSTGSIVMSPDAGYGDVTSYQKLDPGTYTVSIYDAGAPADATPTLSRSFTAAAGKAQTIAVIGTASAPRLAILSDDLTPPAAGSARVRVLSASSLAPMVNVMAVNGPTIATDAVLGTTTGYTTVPDGPWTLNLSGSSMSSRQTVTLASGSVYTAVALDSGTTAVTIKVITDAAGAVATPVGAAATGFGGAALQQADTTSPTSSPSVVWVAMAALLGSLVLGSALLRTAVARTRRQPVRVTSGR